jgi:mono/diheme cytochrome c family protein
MPRRIWFLVLIAGLPVAMNSAQQSQKQGQEHPALPAAGGTTAQSPHNFAITPEDRVRKNPARFTDISVARGKDLFQTQCAMCHGEKGKGKGTLATEMNIAPPDFTNPEILTKRTDGELFAIIGKGSTPMPGESKRLTARQTWDLVNFLRAVEGKTPATATAEEREKAKEAHTVVVPH